MDGKQILTIWVINICVELKSKIGSLKQKVEETNDQTHKSRVKTERVQKLNDKISTSIRVTQSSWTEPRECKSVEIN